MLFETITKPAHSSLLKPLAIIKMKVMGQLLFPLQSTNKVKHVAQVFDILCATNVINQTTTSFAIVTVQLA